MMVMNIQMNVTNQHNNSKQCFGMQSNYLVKQQSELCCITLNCTCDVCVYVCVWL